MPAHRTLLSQNTTDITSARAFATLKQQFPTWDAVRAAPPADVADAIRVRAAGHGKPVLNKQGWCGVIVCQQTCSGTHLGRRTLHVSRAVAPQCRQSCLAVLLPHHVLTLPPCGLPPSGRWVAWQTSRQHASRPFWTPWRRSAAPAASNTCGRCPHHRQGAWLALCSPLWLVVGVPARQRLPCRCLLLRWHASKVAVGCRLAGWLATCLPHLPAWRDDPPGTRSACAACSG